VCVCVVGGWVGEAWLCVGVWVGGGGHECLLNVTCWGVRVGEGEGGEVAVRRGYAHGQQQKLTPDTACTAVVRSRCAGIGVCARGLCQTMCSTKATVGTCYLEKSKPPHESQCP